MRFAVHVLPLFVPVMAAWAAWHEKRILRLGLPLADDALEDATRMGVRHPEKIRVLHVERIPILNGHLIRLISRFVPEISAHTVGLSLRYGIYVRTKYAGNSALLAHECVHTAQYERLGGFRNFLRAYFDQCLVCGYPDAPLEQEAIMRAADLGDSIT